MTKILVHPKVSEGVAPPAEKIPRKRGRARPGGAAHKVGNGPEVQNPRTEERVDRSKHDGEENNQEHGNRVYANILSNKEETKLTQEADGATLTSRPVIV